MNNVKIAHVCWCDRGNIGDDLFRNIVRDEILKRNSNVEITAAQEVPSSLAFDLTILGGGDVLSSWAYGWDVEFAHFISKGARGIILGAGVRNFYDNEKIANFSIDNFNLLKSNLDKCDHVFVRDDVTQAYLKNMTPKEIECIGDIALLVDKHDIGNKIKTTPGRTVAINVANTYNECFGLSDDKISEKIVEVTVQLMLAGFDVKLFSMYILDNIVIKKIADQVKFLTDKEIDVICHDYFTPEEWAGFFSKCNMVISERLHGCILAAAVNTPFISLAYRWKCINFCLLFGLPHLAIKTDNLQSLDTVINYVRDNTALVSKHIAERKTSFIGKISRAFDRISDVIIDIQKENSELNNNHEEIGQDIKQD